MKGTLTRSLLHLEEKHQCCEGKKCGCFPQHLCPRPCWVTKEKVTPQGLSALIITHHPNGCFQYYMKYCAKVLGTVGAHNRPSRSLVSFVWWTKYNGVQRKECFTPFREDYANLLQKAVLQMNLELREMCEEKRDT